MEATMVVFENSKERAMMCADVGHDWINQEEIFGSDTQELLETCAKLTRAVRDHHVRKQLLEKISDIASRHELTITWYGEGCGPCEPDRFLVSGRGVERLAFIQC